MLYNCFLILSYLNDTKNLSFPAISEKGKDAEELLDAVVLAEMMEEANLGKVEKKKYLKALIDLCVSVLPDISQVIAPEGASLIATSRLIKILLS